MTVRYAKTLCSMLLCASLVVNSTAMAQWGNNAPPCSNGHCAPTAVWGYNATCWRRWPGAMYPDMIVPTQPSNRGPAGIQPGNIELPPSTGEADVRPPSPTRQPQYSPTPRPGFDEGFREPAPIDQPFQTPAPGVQDAFPSPHSGIVPMDSHPVNTPVETAPMSSEPSGDTTTYRAPAVQEPAATEPVSVPAPQNTLQAEAPRETEMRIDLGGPGQDVRPEVTVLETAPHSLPAATASELTGSQTEALQLASANAELDQADKDRDNPYPTNSLQRRLRATAIRAKAKVPAKTAAPKAMTPEASLPAIEAATPADEPNRLLESSRRRTMNTSDTAPAAHVEAARATAAHQTMPILSSTPSERAASAIITPGATSLPESNPLRSSPVKPASFQLPEQPTWRPATSSSHSPAPSSSTFQSNPLR